MTDSQARLMKVPEDTDEANAQRVQLRMERQKRLQDGPARLWVILDEAVLKRPVGGHPVMADQLDHLARMSASPKVTVQVLPSGSGNCVELSVGTASTALRDTKDRDGGTLDFTRDAFGAFLSATKTPRG